MQSDLLGVGVNLFDVRSEQGKTRESKVDENHWKRQSRVIIYVVARALGTEDFCHKRQCQAYAMGYTISPRVDLAFLMNEEGCSYIHRTSGVAFCFQDKKQPTLWAIFMPRRGCGNDTSIYFQSDWPCTLYCSQRKKASVR